MFPSTDILLHIIDNGKSIVIVGLKDGQGVLARVLKLVDAGASNINLFKDYLADNNDNNFNALLDQVFPYIATITTIQELTEGAI